MEDVHHLERTPLEEFMEVKTTYDLFRQCAETYPKNEALVFLLQGRNDEPAPSLTYSQLLQQIHQTANFLHRLEVGPKDVVSTLLPNMIETHLSLWGSEAAGIANPISPLLEAAQIAGIMNAVHSKVLITLPPLPGSDLWDKVKEVATQVRGLRSIVTVDLPRYLPLHKRAYLRIFHLRPKRLGQIPCYDFHSMIRSQPKDRLISGRKIQPEDTASFFHTGGTTGIPKLAAHTHFNEAFMGTILGSVVDLQEGASVLCGLPLFHVNAVMVTGLGPFLAGARVIIQSATGYRGEGVLSHFWPVVEKFEAVLFSAVPTVFSSLLQYPVGDYDLSSLKYAITGAAPMPKEVFVKFQQKTGLKILEGYGQTEGTCVSSFNPPFGESRIGSIGIRIPYQEMKVVHRHQEGNSYRDCETEEIGSVIIRGPNVFPGYTEPSKNEGVWLKDGWLDTGDLGRMDTDGFFWLTGRAKDLILRGGHNLDPAMIEEALCSHPQIELAAAVGQPDAHAGELPVAFVQPYRGMHPDLEEIQQFAREKIPEKAAIPIRIEIVDSLPLTAIGKLYKPPLRHRTISHVYTHILKEVGIDSQIRVVEDASRGTLAKITLKNRDALKKAGEILGIYTIPCEFDVP
jgi:fatty-acyl-CoA synthase